MTVRVPSPVGPVYMFGPPGARTTELPAAAALLLPAAAVAVAVAAEALTVSVALGSMLARMELAWSGVIVVTELEVLVAAELEDEPELPENAPPLGRARLPSASETMSMYAIVGPATIELVAWSRMLFASGWPSDVM